jgi:lipopolysaccharide transport system permease protein
MNFSIWITPVFYPTTILPASLSNLMYINPMAFVIEGYRFSLLGSPAPSPYYLISVIPVIILLFTGLIYFLKVEDDIVDRI